MEWSLGVEPWSGVLEWILEWNEVRFGQDLVLIDRFLVNTYFYGALCTWFPLFRLSCVAHMLQSSFEYLLHNR